MTEAGRRLSQSELVNGLRDSSPRTQRALVAVLNRHLPRSVQLYFFRELFFQAADAVCILGYEGRILVFNQAFRDYLDQPMEEMLGRPIGEVVALDAGRFARITERLGEGHAEHDYEFILTREGRAPRVLSLSMTPLWDPVERAYSLTVVVARDVTGRRELERQVVEWQERARQYLYAIHPPEIAEAMVEGRVEARNLEVSVLFTDITNFTSFTSQVSASEVARALHRYFTAMAQVVLDHHGWVDKFVGDSIMALFGVPGGSPDHARQGVRAAAEMARLMSELGLPWRHRIGIASGQVIAGDIGSQQKPTYTAIGDPVNLASRLTAMARPGEVLLCPRTYAAVAGNGFAYEDLGELDVRGYGVSQVVRLLTDPQRTAPRAE